MLRSALSSTAAATAVAVGGKAKQTKSYFESHGDDESSLPFRSRRSDIYALHGMVASSQPLASNIGLDVLKAGGNAVDAAVAVAAALAVTEPCSTGMGGDCFLLYYDAKTRTVSALNGSGRAAGAMTLANARRVAVLDPKRPSAPLTFPPFHALTVTVPGAAQGWCDAVEKWGSGRLTLASIVEPAARLAEEGFPVGPIAAHHWAKGERQLRSTINHREMLLDGGGGGGGGGGWGDGWRAPRPGEVFCRPGLADALRRLGREGRKGFYEGAVASAIVEEVRSHGGLLSMEDLRRHESTFPEPISATFRGARLHEVPPNGQGIAALLALNLLSELEKQNSNHETPPKNTTTTAPAAASSSSPPLRRDTLFDASGRKSLPVLHTLIEVMRLAFADTRAFVADPDHPSTTTATNDSDAGAIDGTMASSRIAVPTADALLSPDYAAQRIATAFSSDRAAVDAQAGSPEASSCTVSFQVVDDAGNAVSMVNSNYMGFGTGLVPRGFGFTLQNRGHNFSLDPRHPNCVAGGKRPFHTIIPAMVTHADDGQLLATISNMGGFMQPQGHVQLLLHLVVGGLSAQEAVDAPRFCITDGTAGGVVALEEGLCSPAVAAALSAMGHPVVGPLRGHDRANFGRAQVITRDRTSGVLAGGSDGRADGCAMGY